MAITLSKPALEQLCQTSVPRAAAVSFASKAVPRVITAGGRRAGHHNSLKHSDGNGD